MNKINKVLYNRSNDIKEDNFEWYIIKFFEIIEDNEKTGKYEIRITIGDVLSGRIDIIDKGEDHE